MFATVSEILGRPHHVASVLPNLDNFLLREIGQLPARKILESSQISLYSLDFEHRRAVFVETPADVDLSQASFFFRTQFEKAVRVLTISFETLIQLANSLSIEDERLIFIYSVGRCGSTLASQIFAQVPGVISMSEPFALSQLVVARNTKTAPNEELIALLEASIAILCKSPAPTAWAVKGQSFAIELGDWLHKLYPRARNLFLYRQADTWLLSGLRAYVGDVETDAAEHRAREARRRELLGSLVPAIANYDAELPLSHAGMLALMWLTAMERYVQLCDAGAEMLAIRYASWLATPRETADAMLAYCQCMPDDMTAIAEVLNRDSQAGTHLARDAVRQRERAASESDLEQLRWHLRNHAFIHDVDYEAPNTLKI